MGDRSAARLSRLLEDERSALMTGSFDRLGVLAERKERLFAQLAPTDPALPDLAAGVTRNQRLLEAAMRGLATGQAAIAERRAGPRLTTYAADGTTSAPTGPAGPAPLDRRA